jgi:hypothetical protein
MLKPMPTMFASIGLVEILLGLEERRGGVMTGVPTEVSRAVDIYITKAGQGWRWE